MNACIRGRLVEGSPSCWPSLPGRSRVPVPQSDASSCLVFPLKIGNAAARPLTRQIRKCNLPYTYSFVFIFVSAGGQMIDKVYLSVLYSYSQAQFGFIKSK